MPAAGQVLVETIACGICGSDLHCRLHAHDFVAASRAAGMTVFDFDPDRDLDIDGLEDGDDGDGGAFHDPVLRRALAHAPDHAVVPMDETRESILSFAHEAVAPSLPAGIASAG